MLSCHAVMRTKINMLSLWKKNPVGVQAITTVAYCQPCCQTSELEWVPKVVTVRVLKVDNPTGIFQVS